MKLLRQIVLIAAGVSGTKFLQAFIGGPNQLADSELAKVLVRQQEQFIADASYNGRIVPARTLHGLSLTKYGSDNEGDNQYTIQPFSPVTAIPKKALEIILNSAYKLIGDLKENDGPELFTLHRDCFFMYALSTHGLENTIVIVYRPVLLSMKVGPHLLRLINLMIANREYTHLLAYLQREGESLKDKKIILVGTAEAGLVANYHAVRLIRQHPIIAPNGLFINRSNQVQIISVCSPAPFNRDTFHYLRINYDNFLAFGTVADEDENFVNLGHQISHAYPEVISNPLIKKEESFLQGYFEKQNLVGCNAHELLTGAINYNGPVKSIFDVQVMMVRVGVSSAAEKYQHFLKELLFEDHDLCMTALADQLGRTLSQRHDQVEKDIANYRFRTNWTLKSDIKCSRIERYGRPQAQCYFIRPSGTRVFANYRLILENEQYENFMKKSSDSINIVIQESWEGKSLPLNADQKQEEEAFTNCLRDLFDVQPLLRMFSPFHKENSFDLEYSKWPFQKHQCKAELIIQDSLLEMSKVDPHAFVSLMTAPNFENPQSCQNHYHPAPNDRSSVVHTDGRWARFDEFISTQRSKFLTTHQNDEISEIYIPSHLNEDIVKAELFSVIHRNMGKDPQAHQYNCLDPATLWHSFDFCPKMCRTLEGQGNNFCERVYVSPSGLKLSLRSASQAQVSNFRVWMDRSMEERDFIKRWLKLDHPDRSVIFVTFKMNNQLYYLAVFLEPPIIEQFLRI